MAEYSDAISDYLDGPRQAAGAQAIASMDANPDAAATALDLERHTGVPADIIHGDLEGFQRQDKTALITHILNTNDQLTKYINTNPMAAKVSNDDYGNLDTYSGRLKRFATNQSGQITSILGKVAEGFKAGWGEEPTGAWLTESEASANFVKNFPLTTANILLLAKPAEAGFLRLPGALASAAAGGLGEAYVQAGGNAAMGQRLARDIVAMANSAMGEPVSPLALPFYAVEAQHAFVKDFVGAIKPFVDAGVEPPVGIHPVIDQVKAFQADADRGHLEEALKVAAQSTTRERAPDLFAAFTRQHTDAELGIPAAAVRALYGDKEPVVGSGPLGFVKDLPEQLRAAEVSGSDIKFPVADFLAYADPAEAKVLLDDIRVSERGMTPREASELEPQAERARVEPPLLAEPEINAVREAAALKPLADVYQISAEDYIFDQLGFVPAGEPEAWARQYGWTGEPRKGEWTKFHPDVRAFVPEKLTRYEAELNEIIRDELQRIVPRGTEWAPALDIRMAQKDQVSRAYGMRIAYRDQLPIILYALTHNDPIGTARHEAIHHLRQRGFFHEGEWSTLERVAHEEDWINKERHGPGSSIVARYPGLEHTSLLEEAIADEFKYWKRDPNHPSIKDSIFARLREFLSRLRGRFEALRSKNPAVDAIFRQVDRGEVGSREPGMPLEPGTYVPLAEKTPAPDVLFKKAEALGMTVEQFGRYTKLIQKLRDEDAAYQLKKAKAIEAKQQTAEWKAHAKDMREDVRRDIEGRPDIVATVGFYDHNIKMDPQFLNEEQKAGLPRQFVKPGGLNPDDIANVFGFQSGDVMVAHIASLEQARGGVPLKEFLNQQISAEVEARMVAKYGVLEKNILDAALDHVVGNTQMEALHEETLGLAMRAGESFDFSKEQIQAAVLEDFGKLQMSGASRDGFLDAAGRAGRLAEKALLRGQYTEAFRAKQQQYFSLLRAKEAYRLERTQRAFEKTAKQYAKRDVGGIPEEYAIQVQDILQRVGRKLDTDTSRDLASRLEGRSLTDFVEEKRSMLRELEVADFLEDRAWAKPVEKMTVNEFRALAGSIKSLADNAREERSVLRAGEKIDLEMAKKALGDQFTRFGLAKQPAPSPMWWDKARNLRRTVTASVTQIETLFNRIDGFDAQGPWNQIVMRPLVEGSNRLATLEREYSQKLVKTLKIADPKKQIENTIFLDPHTGQPLPMTRENMLGVMLHVGNPENFHKLTEGWKVDPGAVMTWLDKHATAEDWKWAQKMGDLWAEIKDLSDNMVRELGQTPTANIEVTPVTTKHGTFKGWYSPLIYDSLYEGKSKKMMGKDPLELDNYFRATTPQSYTKARTGYVAPLRLGLDYIPHRMRQMLNDIAMRPAVINASKIFYDHSLRAEFTKHFGAEYRDLLMPYLQDVANHANRNDAAAAVFDRWSEYFRQNLVSTLIGFNPGTVLKHGPTALMQSITEVGPLNFAKAVKDLFGRDPIIGERNWSFALRTSEELQRRHQNYIDTLRGANENILEKPTLRNRLIHAGAWTVSKSDLASAVPTWLAAYRKALEEGSSHGDAIYLADRAVRRAHGSVATTNRPRAMRGGAIAQWSTSLYGFFNHILNRQLETVWRAGEALGYIKKGEVGEASKYTPELLNGIWSYVLFPALVEEAVTPLTNDKHESWGKWALFGVANTLGASWPGLRDMTHAALSGHDPGTGILSEAYKTVANPVHDLLEGTKSLNRQKLGSTVQHGVNLFGLLSGLTNAQEGKIAKFLTNYATGQEHPRGLGAWYRGLRTGTAKEKHR